MNNSKIERIQTARVIVGDKRRSLDAESVSKLAHSMATIGLKTPIVVRRVGDQQRLVAGLHRVEAAKSLEWEFIEAFVMQGDETDARLVEITENLHRSDLTQLERAEQEAEWIRILKAKGISGQIVRKSQAGRPEGGIAKAARESPVRGKTPEAKRKALARSQKIDGISAEAKFAIKKAGLDNHQAALITVAEEKTPEDQLKMVHELSKKRVRTPRLQPKTVAARSREAEAKLITEENPFARWERASSQAVGGLRSLVKFRQSVRTGWTIFLNILRIQH